MLELNSFTSYKEAFNDEYFSQNAHINLHLDFRVGQSILSINSIIQVPSLQEYSNETL